MCACCPPHTSLQYQFYVYPYLSITHPPSSPQLRRRTALPSELAAGRERPRSEPPIPENVVVEGEWLGHRKRFSRLS